MTALEEIKKALEGATLYPGPWEVGELIKRRPYSDAWELQNATDLFGYIYCGHEAPEDVKPVVEYIAAVNPVAITELVSTLESLQRENEALKKDRDFWKEQFQVETRYRIELADRGTLLALTDANSRAEAAEAEAKMLREALHKIESGYGANDICARIARDALSAQVQDVAGWQLVPIKPTKAMAYAAACEHYGKKRVDQTGIEGISMTVNGIDYNFPTAFRKFWKGALAAAPVKQEG